jgi:Ca2+-binding EF-hand superfamily protein
VQVLLPEDFEAFFPDEDKAHRAFALFDSNGDGSVSIRECKDTIRYG